MSSPLLSPRRSALVEAAERFQESYIDSTASVPQSQSDARQRIGVQRVLEKVQRVPQKPQNEQLQSPLSLDELHESMRSLHAELAQMSLSMRSVIRDEMGESMKAFQWEQSQMHHSMRTMIHKEVEECIKSAHAEGESRSNRTMRSIIRSELKESMKDCPSSHSMRSVIHNGLDEFMKPLVAGGKMAVQGSKHAEENTLECQGSSKQIISVAAPALKEPLLGGTACKEQMKNANSITMQDNVLSTESRRGHLLKIDGQAQKDRLKEALQEALADDGYNVEDLYQETGLWQAWARQNSWFSHGSLVVVAANVAWIGIDEDLNQEDILSKAPILSQVINNVFCMFFTFEVMVHLLAFKNKANAFRDGKFLFDLLLVGFMVWETWIEVFLYQFANVKDSSNSAFTTQIFRFFRLFRLTRVPRIAKLCLAVPELMIMMKGIAAAMRSVMVIVVFLLFTVYVFGILFTELLKNIAPFTNSFGNVRTSMYTLLLQVLCGVDTDFLDDLFAAGVVYWLIYLVFLFMANFTLLNMLIGVLCDVVSDVREAEISILQARALEHEISMVSELVDQDHSGSISKDEFEQIMNTKAILKSLDGMEVDVVALAGLAEMIFMDAGDLSLSEFCEMITQFRGSRVATVKDLLDTHKFMHLGLNTVTRDIKNILDTSQSQLALPRPSV